MVPRCRGGELDRARVVEASARARERYEMAVQGSRPNEQEGHHGMSMMRRERSPLEKEQKYEGDGPSFVHGGVG